MSAAKAEKKEGGKKSPMPLIIGAVVVVLALFMAKSVLGGKKEDDGEKKEKKKHQKVVVGEYMALEPDFTVNLAGGGDHYLKTGISLGVTKEMTEEQFKHHLSPMRDAIISILSAKQVKDFATLKNKEALKEEIKTKLNDITEDAVVEVCFTSFATQ